MRVTSAPTTPTDGSAASPPRHVRGRSPIIDVVTDLHADVMAASFPLELAEAAELRALRDRVVTQIGSHLLPRLKRDEAPAIVVLGGSTGAGKSTLLNSVLGTEVSAAGVVRPTTREPVLASQPDDAWLLDAHPVAELAEMVTNEEVPIGLGLLDAPDLDSVKTENRSLSNMLLEAADLWVFVTTAARYGDAVPWRVLEQARDRGITIAIVLNRVPREALAAVRTDLLSRIEEMGLGSAPLFVIPEIADHEGLIPDEAIEELRDWLQLLGGRHTSRGIVRRTSQGVWAALRTDLLHLADGITSQAMAAGTLRSLADHGAGTQADELRGAISAGAAVSGAPTTRWLAAASDGGPLAPLTRRAPRLRLGWRSTGLMARSRAAEVVAAESGKALAAVTSAAAGAAFEAIHSSWAESSRGAGPLLEDIAANDEADRDERVARALQEWADRSETLAGRALAASAVRGPVRRALDEAGLAGLLQAAAAGIDGAARAVTNLLGADGRKLINHVRDDMLETVAACIRDEATPFTAALDALELRSEAGAGLRLRASELKGHL